MAVENVLYMNSGNGESSYANNSVAQETVIRKAWPVLAETIKGVVNGDGCFPQCFKIADLGCSSGPNTLLVVSSILDTVHFLCKEKNCKTPEFQICLNDLPENDFNTIYKSLPEFYAKLKKEKGDNFGPCFISGVAGSFYGRLFPKESMDLVHSSSSLHWLSQVPEGLENNKNNVYISKTSPPEVVEAYLKQFQRDFSTFLRMRSKEIVHGGHTVLTFVGRSIPDPTSRDCCALWDLVTKSLLDMVAEGLAGEADIDAFNFPFYAAYKDEIKDIIQNEGSFTLDNLDFFEVNWDGRDNDDDIGFDKDIRGKYVAKSMRAIGESLLASHFGEGIMDKLFERYAKHAADHLTMEKAKFFNHVISLTKK